MGSCCRYASSSVALSTAPAVDVRSQRLNRLHACMCRACKPFTKQWRADKMMRASKRAISLRPKRPPATILFLFIVFLAFLFGFVCRLFVETIAPQTYVDTFNNEFPQTSCFRHRPAITPSGLVSVCASAVARRHSSAIVFLARQPTPSPETIRFAVTSGSLL